MQKNIDHFINSEVSKLAEERRQITESNNQLPSNKNKWIHNTEIKLAIDHDNDKIQEGGILNIGLDPKRKIYSTMLNEERKKEYNEIIAIISNKQSSPNKTNINDKGNEYNGLIAKLGSYEDKRLKLQEERRQEYNQLLEKQKLSRNRRKNNDVNSNIEYIQTQKPKPNQNNDSPQHQIPPKTDSYVSVNVEPPKNQMQYVQTKNLFEDELERLRAGRNVYDNRYNDRYKETRDFNQSVNGQSQRAWESPIPRYDELLEKKRRIEKEYRRLADASSYVNYDQAHRSDEYNHGYTNGTSERENNSGYKGPENIIRQASYEELQKPNLAFNENIENNTRNYKVDDNLSKPKPPAATLLIGHQVTSSADKRRKDEYRNELLKQMQEAKINKNKEKIEYYSPVSDNSKPAWQKTISEIPNNAKPQISNVNQNMMLNSHLNSVPMVDSYPPKEQQYIAPMDFNQVYQNNMIPYMYQPTERYQPVANQMSPEYVQKMFYSGLRPDGVLLNGFDFNRPRNIEAFGVQPVLLQNSPLENALYNLQTNRNELRPEPIYNNAPSSTQMPIFENPSQNNMLKLNVNRIDDYGYFNNNDPSNLDKKKQYQLELQRQMEDSKLKKQRDKLETEAYDRKIQAEMEKYAGVNPANPAPLRDQFGNIIGTRRRGSGNNQIALNNFQGEINKSKNSMQFETSRPELNHVTPIVQDSIHSRGGNGIFGDPMSDEQKKSKSKYQEDLQQQINEKKLREQEEKELQRLEEEKFMKKIEEDKQKLLRDQEEEQRKVKEKAEAEERRQQELKRHQEELRLELEKKKQDQRMARDQARIKEDTQRQTQHTPITGRNGHLMEVEPISFYETTHNFKETNLSSSPPVPTKRRESKQLTSRISRVENKEVLAQLSKMRHLLQNERLKIETESLKDDELNVSINNPEQKVNSIKISKDLKKSAIVKKSYLNFMPRNTSSTASMMESLAIGQPNIAELKISEETLVPHKDNSNYTFRVPSSSKDGNWNFIDSTTNSSFNENVNENWSYSDLSINNNGIIEKSMNEDMNKNLNNQNNQIQALNNKESMKYSPQKSLSPKSNLSQNNNYEIPSENVWKRSDEDLEIQSMYNDKLESKTEFLDYSSDHDEFNINDKENELENSTNIILDHSLSRSKTSLSLDAEELQKKNNDILKKLNLLSDNEQEDDEIGYSNKYKSQGRFRIPTPTDDSWMRTASRINKK